MYVSAHLTAGHDVAAFDSGEPRLDEWLRDSALDAERRGTARTFVLVDRDGAVAAYYSLAAFQIVRDVLPARAARGNPGQIPAVLLAKLALRQAEQGRGLGSALLADAMQRVVDATTIVAARYVVADALHEKAAGFYERHGFLRAPGTLRLVRKVADVADDLDR